MVAEKVNRDHWLIGGVVSSILLVAVGALWVGTGEPRGDRLVKAAQYFKGNEFKRELADGGAVQGRLFYALDEECGGLSDAEPFRQGIELVATTHLAKLTANELRGTVRGVALKEAGVKVNSYLKKRGAPVCVNEVQAESLRFQSRLGG